MNAKPSQQSIFALPLEQAHQEDFSNIPQPHVTRLHFLVDLDEEGLALRQEREADPNFTCGLQGVVGIVLMSPF